MMDTMGTIGLQTAELSFAELAPLLDELNAQFVTVEAKVINYGKPAGGAEGLFLELIAVGGVIYLKGFIEALASDHAEALQAAILATLRKGKASKRPSGSIPLRVRVGALKFYFYKPLSLDEFARRLAASREYVDALPDEMLLPAADRRGHGVYWNVEAEAWEPAELGWEGDICPPDAG